MLKFSGYVQMEQNVSTFIINFYSLSDPGAYDKSHFFITSSALLNKTKTQLASSLCQFVRGVCVDEVKNIKEINKFKKSTST